MLARPPILHSTYPVNEVNTFDLDQSLKMKTMSADMLMIQPFTKRVPIVINPISMRTYYMLKYPLGFAPQEHTSVDISTTNEDCIMPVLSIMNVGFNS